MEKLNDLGNSNFLHCKFKCAYDSLSLLLKLYVSFVVLFIADFLFGDTEKLVVYVGWKWLLELFN